MINLSSHFSIGFLKCFCASRGFKLSIENEDDFGIDCLLRARVDDSDADAIAINVQVKCEQRKSLPTKSHKYQLKLRNYSKLIRDNPATPKYLVLIYVKKSDRMKWFQNTKISIDDQALGKIYLIDLMGLPPSNKSGKNAKVSIDVKDTDLISEKRMKEIFNSVYTAQGIGFRL